MSTITNIEDALGALVATAIYPSGTASPSVANTDILVISGWPIKNKLDAQMAAGKAIVSIFKIRQMERDTSRYPREWQQVSVNNPTLTTTINGQTLTIGGTVSTPQSVMTIIDGQSYVYIVQANDTLNTIAANLGALIPGATVANNTITVNGTHSFIARIGVTGTSGKELKRSEAVFSIATWAPTPAIRAAISDAIDVALADQDFISMPDSYAIRIRYAGTQEIDDPQESKIFRRDLNYLIEYPTVRTETEYTITYPDLNSLTLS